MQLTLRTLLAWLDGRLPEEEQQALGEKVSGSQFASLLAERIRLAVGRAAIGAPAVDARGLEGDANSVAEYLDTSLPIDKRTAFERICLESDMHLAEVAACHAISAEIARNQGIENDVPESRKQQLKSLVRGQIGRDLFGAAGWRPPSDSGDEHHESRETARALRAVLGQADAAEDGAASAAEGEQASPAAGVAVENGPIAAVNISDGGMERSVMPRATRAAWWSALIAISLLVTLLGVLAWSVFRQGGRRGGPQQVAAAKPAAAAMTDVVSEPAAQPTGTTATTGEEVPNATRVEVATRLASDPEKADAAAMPVDTADDRPKPAAEEVSRSAPATAVGAPPSAAGPDRKQPSRPVPVAAAVGSGTLLRLATGADGDEWRFAPIGTNVQPGDELLVPPSCEATIAVGGAVARLLPGADVLYTVDRDGMPWVELLSGRAVMLGSGAGGKIGVAVGGLRGILAVDASTRVAVEAVEAADAALEPGGFVTAGERPFTWQAAGADGAVAAGAAPLQVAAGSAVVWESDRAALAAGVPTIPWLESAGLVDRLQKSAADALAARLSADRPLLLTLREMAAEKQLFNRMIAAATLAFVGESDELVEMLVADSSSPNKLEEVKWQTLEQMAVPATLARGGEAAAGLHQAFIDRGPRDKGELLWAMARGFTDDEIAAGADRVLVESLDDPNLIVRRYAFKTLCDIVRPAAADKIRYRPDGLPDLRRGGVAWWKEQLARGLIRR